MLVSGRVVIFEANLIDEGHEFSTWPRYHYLVGLS